MKSASEPVQGIPSNSVTKNAKKRKEGKGHFLETFGKLNLKLFFKKVSTTDAIPCH